METGSLEWHRDPAKADFHRSLREDTEEERDEMMEMKQREEGKGKGEGVLAWRSGGVELRPGMLPCGRAVARSGGRCTRSEAQKRGDRGTERSGWSGMEIEKRQWGSGG